MKQPSYVVGWDSLQGCLQPFGSRMVTGEPEKKKEKCLLTGWLHFKYNHFGEILFSPPTLEPKTPNFGLTQLTDPTLSTEIHLCQNGKDNKVLTEKEKILQKTGQKQC